MTARKPWISVPILARLVGCDRRTILRMIEAGSVKAERHGRCWRIQLADAVEAFPQSMAEYRVAS